MRDQRIGTGGLAYLFMVAIITFASLATIPAIIVFPILFISEISAKVGLVTCCTFSKPFEDGTGRFFINAMDMKKLILILIITLFIGFLTLKTVGILGIIGGLAGGMIISLVAGRNFEKATGDVLGASNEISRMIALVIMILVVTGLII